MSFICPQYFSGNVFKFFIFFNLLTFNKRVESREKWVTLALCCDWLFAGDVTLALCCDWLFAGDVTHSCARASLTQDQAWVDRESWWSASWYQQSQIGVVWFCQLKTNPITLSLLIYHHGTGLRTDHLTSLDHAGIKDLRLKLAGCVVYIYICL